MPGAQRELHPQSPPRASLLRMPCPAVTRLTSPPPERVPEPRTSPLRDPAGPPEVGGRGRGSLGSPREGLAGSSWTRAPSGAGRGAHLELVHDFANGFAAGTDDAGVDAVVQEDVLRNHLLELPHDLQDGVPGGLRVLLVACDGDLVLGLRREKPVRRARPRDRLTGRAEPGRPPPGAALPPRSREGERDSRADCTGQVGSAHSAAGPSPRDRKPLPARGPDTGG